MLQWDSEKPHTEDKDVTCYIVLRLEGEPWKKRYYGAIFEERVKIGRINRLPLEVIDGPIKISLEYSEGTKKILDGYYQCFQNREDAIYFAKNAPGFVVPLAVFQCTIPAGSLLSRGKSGYRGYYQVASHICTKVVKPEKMIMSVSRR